MRMHWILRGAAKQEAQPNPASYSREDSTFGDLATVAYVHISCNVQDTVEPPTAILVSHGLHIVIFIT